MPMFVQERGAAGVEAVVNDLDPSLLRDNPTLRFDLWRCEFHRLVGGSAVIGSLGSLPLSLSSRPSPPSRAVIDIFFQQTLPPPFPPSRAVIGWGQGLVCDLWR